MGQSSTQPLKAVVRRALQIYHLHMPIVLKSGSLNLLEPSGPGTGLYEDCSTFSFTYIFIL